jgi:hypothetical protein
MTNGTWVLVFGFGLWISYLVGRVRAEFGRARHEMRKAWNSRANYRD